MRLLKEKWDDFDPKKKRLAVVGAVVLVALVVISMVTGQDSGKSSSKASRQEVIKNVLTDSDTRNVGLDALSADLKALRSDNRKIERQIQTITRDLENNKRDAQDVPPQFKSQLTRMSEELDKISKQLKESETKKTVTAGVEGDSATQAGVGGSDQGGQSVGTGASADGLSLDPNDPLSVFKNSKWKTSTLNPNPANRTGTAAGAQAAAAPALKLKTYVEEEPVVEAAEKTEDDSLYMPAGSIITGSLINGIDAPTGNGARKDPFPSLLRIQKEAILPNRFRADVRECFLIISGFGDLSSERAYLRGETISCVREDGGVIEARLDSYAVGEDGKAGVRGRLVSKQGQIIAKSLMAGFLSGVSEAFDVKPVPIIDTTNSGSTSYSKNSPNSNWLQSATVSGVGNALDRIADFYLEMAESMFPVIEVDAGRQIDVIVNRGTKLQIRSTGANG